MNVVLLQHLKHAVHLIVAKSSCANSDPLHCADPAQTVHHPRHHWAQDAKRIGIGSSTPILPRGRNDRIRELARPAASSARVILIHGAEHTFRATVSHTQVRSMIQGVCRPAVYREAKLYRVCSVRISRLPGGMWPSADTRRFGRCSDSASDATETYCHARSPPPLGLLCSMCNFRAEDHHDRIVLFGVKAMQLCCSPLSLESWPPCLEELSLEQPLRQCSN